MWGGGERPFPGRGAGAAAPIDQARLGKEVCARGALPGKRGFTAASAPALRPNDTLGRGWGTPEEGPPSGGWWWWGVWSLRGREPPPPPETRPPKPQEASPPHPSGNSTPETSPAPGKPPTPGGGWGFRGRARPSLRGRSARRLGGGVGCVVCVCGGDPAAAPSFVVGPGGGIGARRCSRGESTPRQK